MKESVNLDEEEWRKMCKKMEVNVNKMMIVIIIIILYYITKLFNTVLLIFLLVFVY